jgi:hypothetical protein
MNSNYDDYAKLYRRLTTTTGSCALTMKMGRYTLTTTTTRSYTLTPTVGRYIPTIDLKLLCIYLIFTVAYSN